ncbi:MAG: HAMP domain-containing protein [Deltaproteobacteria bacterium]|nr:HAMP domain-containing protein [Deltaproteobacteria bacterium]
MRPDSAKSRFRPRLSLKLRFALIISGAIILLGIANRVYLERRVLREMEVDLDNKALATARYLAAESVDLTLYQDLVRLEDLLAKFVAADPNLTYAFIMDPAHSVIVHTFKGAFPEELRSINRLGPGEEYRERHVSALGQNFRDFAVGIHGGRLGVLRLGVSDRQILTRVAMVRRDLLLMTVVVVVLGAAGAYGFTGFLLRPLERVVSALQRFKPGVHREEIAAGEDEIGDVAARINEVTARLHDTHVQMMRTEKLVAVGQLAAGVAHEINNPLSGVLHCVDNLRADDGDPERRREYYALMADGVSRAQRVVKNLLDYGRAHEPEVRDVDINSVVGQVLALVHAPFERARVRVETALEPALPAIRADPHRVAQVLTNLLLNAMEAMPGGGRVEVTTSRNRGFCRLRVRDSGPGIPDELKGKVFDPFFTTKTGGSSGLGLSVSLSVVEQHGGRIEVSDAPGGGAVFDVYLPANKPAAAEAEPDA